MAQYRDYECVSEGCRNTVGYKGRGRIAQYCATHSAEAAAALFPHRNKQCVMCDVTFQAEVKTGPAPDVCSPACRKERVRRFHLPGGSAHSRNQAHTRAKTYNCLGCGIYLRQGGEPGRATRCRECAAEWARATRHQPRRSPAEPCRDEGCDRAAHARGWCKLHYKRWAMAEGMIKTRPRTDGQRDSDHRRRAIIYKAGMTRVNLVRMLKAEEPNPTCCLCDGPINTALSHPDPMSWSLEHLQPLSLGGSHTRDNVAASHLRCNIRRRVTPVAEYRASLGLDQMAHA